MSELDGAIARLETLCTGSDRSMGVNPAARQIRADIGAVLEALRASPVSPESLLVSQDELNLLHSRVKEDCSSSSSSPVDQPIGLAP